MNQPFEIAELNRRMGNLIKIGTIAEVDYSGPIHLGKVAIGALKTGWLPMLTARAGNDRSSWPLEVGEQVAVFSPGGELHTGLVMGAINQTSKAAPAATADKDHRVYKDGAVFEYDRTAHHYKIALPAGATIEIVAPDGTKHTGNLAVIGAISATENISTEKSVLATMNVTATQNVSAGANISDSKRSMADDRAIYNDHDHGPDGKPVQKQ